MSSRRIKMKYDTLFQGSVDESVRDSAEAGEMVHTVTREELETLMSEYREELVRNQDEMLEKVKNESFREGYQKGSVSIGKKIKRSSDTVLRAFNNIEQQVGDLMTGVKPLIAEMIFDMAEKILELPVENKIMHQRVREQIDRVIDRIGENMTIRIEVSKHDFIQVGELLKSRKSSDHITLVQSKELNPGEFRVDTNREQIVKLFRKSLNDFRASVSFNGPDSNENPEAE